MYWFASYSNFNEQAHNKDISNTLIESKLINLYTYSSLSGTHDLKR